MGGLVRRLGVLGVLQLLQLLQLRLLLGRAGRIARRPVQAQRLLQGRTTIPTRLAILLTLPVLRRTRWQIRNVSSKRTHKEWIMRRQLSADLGRQKI